MCSLPYKIDFKKHIVVFLLIMLQKNQYIYIYYTEELSFKTPIPFALSTYQTTEHNL